MEAVVVVLAGRGDVAHLLEAVRAHEAHERRRLLVDIFRARHERFGLRGDVFLHERGKGLIGFALGQLLAGVLHRLEEVQAVPVDEVHIAGHKDLPAGGQGVVVRVGFVVAPAQQRGDDDLVVRVLREAEALFRERRGELIDGKRRILVYAQVDLRVDEAQIAAGEQAELGKLVIGVGAVCVRATEDDGLAVVALLDADVKIAVAVAGDEELLELLERLVLRQQARVHVMPVIGIQELVNAAEGIVVVAVAPHGVVQQAQKLQRLEKRPGRVGRDPGEHVGDAEIPSAPASGRLPAARGSFPPFW